MLDLNDTLIHSDWTRGRGWRTFKRPGAEDFLRQAGPLTAPLRLLQSLPIPDRHALRPQRAALHCMQDSYDVAWAATLDEAYRLEPRFGRVW